MQTLTVLGGVRGRIPWVWEVVLPTCHSRKQKHINIHRLNDHANVHTYIIEHARNDENKQKITINGIYLKWIAEFESLVVIFSLLLSNDSLIGRSAYLSEHHWQQPPLNVCTCG